MGGKLVHITGTASALYIYDKPETETLNAIIIAAATANGTFALFDRVNTNVQYSTDIDHIWITHPFYLKFAGGTGAYISLWYIEGDIPRERPN